MTRMSSESSKPSSSVGPCANAASNSTRLEILLEPGRRTVPSARETMGSVMDVVSVMIIESYFPKNVALQRRVQENPAMLARRPPQAPLPPATTLDEPHAARTEPPCDWPEKCHARPRVSP